MYKADVFKNAMLASQVPATAQPPSESVLQALEKDLTSTMTKDKRDTMNQQQNGPGRPSPLSERLRKQYGMTDNINYNNKLSDYSAQLNQTREDVQDFTSPFLLTTLEGKDSLNLQRKNFDSFDPMMLYGQPVEHISQKREKLGKKRPVLSHDVHWG